MATTWPGQRSAQASSSAVESAPPLKATASGSCGAKRWMAASKAAPGAAPGAAFGAAAGTLRGGSGIDRKSTRLNSSHLGISYAVFCLKKKNKRKKNKRAQSLQD